MVFDVIVGSGCRPKMQEAASEFFFVKNRQKSCQNARLESTLIYCRPRAATFSVVVSIDIVVTVVVEMISLDDGYIVIDQKRDKGGFSYNILADKSPMRADDGRSRKKCR